MIEREKKKVHHFRIISPQQQNKTAGAVSSFEGHPRVLHPVWYKKLPLLLPLLSLGRCRRVQIGGKKIHFALLTFTVLRVPMGSFLALYEIRAHSDMV